MSCALDPCPHLRRSFIVDVDAGTSTPSAFLHSLEENDLCAPFVPKNAWQLVRGKERMAGQGRTQRWGSLEVLEAMGRRAQSPHERMVVALAFLLTACCLRVNEATSIKAIDLQQSASTIQFYDQRSRRQWVTKPSGDYINRIFCFLRFPRTYRLWRLGPGHCQPRWRNSWWGTSTVGSRDMRGGARGRQCSYGQAVPCRSDSSGDDGSPCVLPESTS